jgi:RNA polymerase sigma-70 factor (ECF subfamily)
MTGSAADAEDLVQDIFLQVYRRLDSYRGEAALGTWLHRLAVNACLDFVRSKQGRRQRVTDQIEDLDALEARGTGPWRADAALDRMDLERAIAQLPPSYRRAFLLHDVEGLEHHEVGEALGIAEGTSKSLLFKARTRLRSLLRGRDFAGAAQPIRAAASEAGRHGER